MDRSSRAFTGVKVFSATMVAQRAQLGDQVSEWLGNRPHLDVVDALVRQSSDSRFHCISIVVFYRESNDVAKPGLERASETSASGRREP